MHLGGVAEFLEADHREPGMEQDVDTQRGDDSGTVAVSTAVCSSSGPCGLDRSSQYGRHMLSSNGGSAQQCRQVMVRTDRTSKSIAPSVRGREIP